MELDSVMLSRMLTALTLGFHIIFATIGVGAPLMISLAEWIGIKRNDQHYIILARRWARGFVVTVAVGVVTGTCIGLQLSLLWPSFMRVAGNVISLPLFMETFAFFFEAIFLGIYLYTWDRFKKPIYHWLISIPIVLGSSASAFFITTVNAFMNNPQGVEIENGVITGVNPIEAMFNPATPTEVGHVLASAYLTSAFVLAAITAFFILKKGNHAYYKKALKFTMIACFVFSIATVVIGDFAGKYLAEHQPEKLAAGEWHFETEGGADLIMGGILTENNEVKYGIKIPNALSILAHGDPIAVVIGLDQYAEELTPPLWIHYMFDLMVTLGMYLAAVSFFYVLADRFRRLNPYNSVLLWMIVLGGPFSMVAIEAGWIFAEVGRQPWILYHVMKTAEAATTADHVGAMLLLFLGLYTLLGTLFTVVMLRMFRNNPIEAELEYRFKS
jgi:cytochrome d ubiquinol oxidase subunit I